MSLLRKVLIILCVFGLLMGNIAKASESWLAGWSYRTPIAIHNDQSTLSNHQVRLEIQGNDINKPNYIDFARVKNGGADIRFTDSDKITPIDNYWIESWDNTAKTAVVWIKIPSITNSTSDYFQFSASSTVHEDYGLALPVTYSFNIQAGSSGLKAWKKYSESSNWVELTQKTSDDYFNSIEAVRFDYSGNKAYVSVGYGSTTDDVFVKITNSNGEAVPVTYAGISKYYDNRVAAVTFARDDWTPAASINSVWITLANYLKNVGMWFTIDVITQNNQTPSNWSQLQELVDGGYMEVASHSRTHPNINTDQNIDFEYQITGSKNDIINNLNLPDLYKKGSKEYVYTFSEPYDLSTTSQRIKLGENKFLADIANPAFSVFPTWDNTYGLYNRWGFTFLDDLIGNHDANLTAANGYFDTKLAAGAVYGILTDNVVTSGVIDWSVDSWVWDHIDYISGRKNVWYAGVGQFFLYDFIKSGASKRVSTSGYSVYLYYGNSGASSLSSYSNVFNKDYGEAGLVSVWHMDETAGNELINDGGLESWASSTSLNNWSNSSVLNGVRDITRENSVVSDGTYSAKITATSNTSTTTFGVYQDISVTSGQTYQVNLSQRYAIRTQGTATFEAWDNTNSVSLGSQTITSATSSYTFSSFRFVATNTSNVRIRANLVNETTGSLYVDNISVRQVAATSTDSVGVNNCAVYGASVFNDSDGGNWLVNKTLAGSSMRFDGKTDYLDCAKNSSLDFASGLFSVSYWVKTDTVGTTLGDGPVVLKGTGDFTGAPSNQRGFLVASPFLVGSRKQIRFAVGNGSGFNYIDSSRKIDDNVWHFITAVAESNRLKIYVDGKLSDEAIRTYTGSATSSSNLFIGRWGGNYYTGALDEVRIHNRPLTLSEIQALYERYRPVDPGFPNARPVGQSQGYGKFFKGVVNSLSATSSVTYSITPTYENLINTNFSVESATGTLNLIFTDSVIQAEYASSSIAGLDLRSIDREIRLTNNGTTSISVIPMAGNLDLNISTWNTSGDYSKVWIESNNISTSSLHTIGDLSPNSYYAVKLDGVSNSSAIVGDACVGNICRADQNGFITFNYVGGYSTHTFSIESSSAPVVQSNNVSTPGRSGSVMSKEYMAKLFATNVGTSTNNNGDLKKENSSATLGKISKQLSVGSKNSDVLTLQKFLNKQGIIISTKGAGSPGKENNYFGTMTKKAVIKFQTKNKIKPANGIVGPKTKALINKIIESDK